MSKLGTLAVDSKWISPSTKARVVGRMEHLWEEMRPQREAVTQARETSREYYV